MKRLFVIRGPICAGKSSLAVALRERYEHAALVEPDIFKQMIDASESTKWRRKLSNQMTRRLVKALMKKGRTIIVTLHGHDISEYEAIQSEAVYHDYEVNTFLLYPPLPTCIERNGLRNVPGMNYTIPSKKIIDFWKNTKRITSEKVFDTSVLSTSQIAQAIAQSGFTPS